MPRLTERYADAVAYAVAAHGSQVRKGTAIPYIHHPIAVSALVVEHGGSEDQAIAGLLHDILEDCGAEHAAPIGERFGREVLSIVEALTDGTPDDHGVKAPWRERKERYLAHLERVAENVVLVSACDKLHNAMAIANDHAVIGAAVFERFSQPRESTLWYYQELLRVLGARLGAGHQIHRRLADAIGSWA